MEKSIRVAVSVLFAFLFGISCNKTETKAVICYPMMWTSGAIVTRTLTYNSNNKVILDTNGECGGHNYYRYDESGNIISCLSGGTTSYTYDANNNLIRQDDNGGYSIIYQYNSTGQLISSTSKYQGNPWGIDKYYEYSNTTTKNSSKVTSTGCCGKMDVHEYEYDNKPNPMKILFPSIHSDNNVIKDTYSISAPPGFGPFIGVIIFICEYNGYGYPTSIVNGGNTKTTITYDCK